MNDYGEMFYGTLPPDTQDFRQVLAGIGRTIRERATTAGQRIVESAREARALQDQAFGDPTRPTRVTDEAALRRLTDMIMAGPMGFAPAGITAYHGSPYLFRMFDPAKVGAGEGAQVYGVGAGYTAEARPVAEAYAQANRGRAAALSGEIDKLPKPAQMEVYKTLNRPEGFIKQAEILDITKRYPETAPIFESSKSYLYKGDIPDEILPKFLDWDKPLYEQSKEVKEALSKLPHRGENWTFKDTIESLEAAPYLRDDRSLNPTGQEIYNMLGSSMMVGNKASGQLEATQKLNELGIRGIRYLDQGSRGNYKAQLIYKGEPYSDVISFATKGQLDDYVKESKGKGFDVKTFQQTSNFVPFRAEDFKIQEINDIPLQQYIEQGLL